MIRTFRRTRQSGWVFAALGGVFGVIALVVIAAIARVAPDEVLYPAFFLLWGLPLAAAAGLGLLAARHLWHHPVLLRLGPEGVTVGTAPEIGWGEIGAIVQRSIVFSYGPREQIVLRRHVPPSDIAAKRAERAVSALFTDVSFAPSSIDLSVDETFEALDAALAEAGLRRAETATRRFRWLHVSRTWTIHPAHA